jgi:DNA mismatch repair protein MutS2
VDEKALQTLEFGKIVERVAALCAFRVSRELAEALTPSVIPAEVERRLALTTQARALLELDPSFSIGGARDIREELRQAGLGRSLLPAQLLDILATIRAARDVRTRFLRLRDAAQRFALFGDLVLGLASFPGLETDISRSINDQGEVMDSASPELGRLRAEVRIAHHRLLDRLNSLLAKYGGAIQEAIITQREGRYVIPVKIGERARVPGLIHDTSASGQTLFVEPMEAVELANRWRKAQIEEQHEVERILLELSQQVGAQAAALTGTLEHLARIDLALALARYSLEIAGSAPRLLTDPPPAGAGGHPTHRLDLRRARHPLLGPGAVPIDLWLGQEARVLVITGPNTGGKTVALKTTGLLVLMAQAGMHIPADDGSALSVFPHVFADIGDEQSIEQSLSTFSSHLSNIVRMLRQVTPASLVLLDELGAGTDPVEGAALARAITAELLARGPLVIATSHYAELKSYAYTTPGVANASVEFDVETLSPTYKLTIGIPGRSNALAIAARLGLEPSIIDAARAMLSHEQVQIEDLLAEVRADRDRTALELRRAQEARRQAERERDALAAQRAELETQKAAAIAEAVAGFEAEIAELRASLRQLERERHSIAISKEWLQQAQARASQVAADFRAAEERRRKDQRRAAPALGLRPGDLVQVHSLGQQGEVVEATDAMALIQLGTLRLRLPTTDLTRLSKGQARQPAGASRPEPPRRAASLPPPPPAPSIEVDLRGMRAHEVEEVLDRVIHDASYSNLPFLRIIHGKGTGALRQVVRDYLQASPLVASYQTAPLNQGGDGVTIATFKDD